MYPVLNIINYTSKVILLVLQNYAIFKGVYKHMTLTITSISFSYLFLGIALIALSFCLYFRLIYAKTSPNSPSAQTIFGEMKHRDDWRERNRMMSYISLFWASISMILFIYFKFFLAPYLVSIFYLLFYAALIVISVIYGTVTKRTRA